ncbi:unnamed protein product [Closterium sp. Yama58-4]|nr:unnamed protein product [Closterium sp. Yama58-4]
MLAANRTHPSQHRSSSPSFLHRPPRQPSRPTVTSSPLLPSSPRRSLPKCHRSALSASPLCALPRQPTRRVTHRPFLPLFPLVLLAGLLLSLAPLAAPLAPKPWPRKCDYSVGFWLRAPKGTGVPRYTARVGEKGHCPYVRPLYACERNNRPDSRYQRYRWHAKKCRLSYFSGTGFKYLMQQRSGPSLLAEFTRHLLGSSSPHRRCHCDAIRMTLASPCSFLSASLISLFPLLRCLLSASLPLCLPASMLPLLSAAPLLSFPPLCAPSTQPQRMLLVGDSIMGNLFEALLCAIHAAGYQGKGGAYSQFHATPFAVQFHWYAWYEKARVHLRTPRCGKAQAYRTALPGPQALLDPKSDEILANAIKEPVAFFGGVVAGILRLDLNEEPLRDWVKRTADAAGVAPTSSKILVDDDEAPLPTSARPRSSTFPVRRRPPALTLRASVGAGNDAAVSAEADDETCEIVHGRDLMLGGDEGPTDASSTTTAAIAAAAHGLGDDREGFRAHLVEPIKNKNGSGVVLLSDVMGLDDADTKMFAYRLACFGYSVLIPDLFRGQPWDASRPQEEYEAWRESLDSAQLATDIDTAARYLAASISTPAPVSPGNGRIALLGFCFGGGRLIEALARDGSSGSDGEGLTAELFSTGVFFYGTRFDPAIAGSIRVPLLLVAGDSDSLCTTEILQEVARRVKGGAGAGGEAVEVVTRVYAGRDHAFAHRPKSMEEDEDAEDAFHATRHWLHAHLLEGAPGWTEPVASVSQIVSAADSPWFTIRDLVKPNSARTIRALSAFANFFLFIHQYADSLDLVLERNEGITESKRMFEGRISEVDAQIVLQDERNKADENESECLKAGLDGLRMNIQELTKQRDEVVKSVTAKQEQLNKLNAEILAEKGKTADAEAEALVLQHQIAQSPQKLEMALKRVEEAIQAETEAKKEESDRAKVFRQKLLMSRDVLEVIKRRNETIQPVVSTADSCNKLKLEIQAKASAIDKLKQQREFLRRKAERIPQEDAVRDKKQEARHKQLEELQTALESAKRGEEAVRKEIVRGESAYVEEKMKLQGEIQEKGDLYNQQMRRYEERNSHCHLLINRLSSLVQSHKERARKEFEFLIDE